VTRIVNFGAFVEILPGLERLLHISEFAEQRGREVQDDIKEGEEILVKVIETDGDRIRLSRKAVLRDQRIERGEEIPEAESARPSAPPPRRPFGGGRRHQSSRHR